MKHALLSLFAILSISFVKAQLPDGSIAPNFTVTAFQPDLNASGMNGNGTYSLYDYLDAGYTVFLDFSTTWCSPCWNYHSSGALDVLYKQHGPLLPGHPGVNANSTNDVMVLWVELDGSTGSSDMLDGAGTIGNWINPTGNEEIPYPMANPEWLEVNTLNTIYTINGYPTVYMICPNRTVKNIWSSDPPTLYAGVGPCPVASGTVNPAILDGSCAIDGGWVDLQNMGSAELTSATLQLKQGATIVSTLNWTGNLSTYETDHIYMGMLTSGIYTVGITSPDDVPEPDNNTMNLTPLWITNSVTVEITTDAYGNETHWCLRENIGTDLGTILALDGDYPQVPSPGTMVQPPVTVDLTPNTCYKFIVIDDFGDGMSTTYGDGSFRLRDADGNILFEGGDFGSYIDYDFKTGELLGLPEEALPDLKIYPNPASEAVTVAFAANNADYIISLIDLQGRTLSTSTYPHLSGEQVITLPLTGVTPGDYLVKVASNGVTTVRKVVVN